MDKFDMLLREKAKTEKYIIPDLLDKKIESIISSFPKKRTAKKRPLVAASVAIAVVATSLTVAYGKDSPIVSKVIEYFKGSNTTLEYGGDVQPLEKYSVDVERSITNNGINIKIDSVACDDNFVALFYTIDGEGQKVIRPETGVHAGITTVNNLYGDIMINGDKRKSSNKDNFMDAYLTDDGKVKGMIRADISGENLGENFEMSFSVRKALGKEGIWDFKFDVSKEEAMKDSKIVNVNKQAYIKYPDGREHNINIEKISFTPFGNQILISEKYSTSSKRDNQGPFNRFVLFDDKGNSLDVVTGQLTSKIAEARNSFEFLKAGKDIKSITLVPIYEKPATSAAEYRYSPILSTVKFPLELKVSDRASCIIEKIDYEDTETIVYYTISGTKSIAEGAFDFVDESGKNVFNKFEVLHKDYILDREKGTHVSIFPKLDKSKNYKIKYYIDAKLELLEQYKIVIPIE